ncbi:MAG: HlyD family efflux transporter periplasmic adaptor subunit [Planctomycetaceae bacterium]|nr:HlyD family efflux transporter periplasmic adaptor subunit [Planctomycetaceae bacterium]MBT6156682.1 HlyD family efflux transporter periplasmic adaptor subunit [Planctomycetaceae bacterium]MBT6486434.1 HlyD family efflux transporter periplasmic adaptor subunit [Planctomycetaceae bacterium]MBT6493999.1 HlyD family efflux transporter periplasmic adaptor subunit [Planctomycetaceae bacterium]
MTTPANDSSGFPWLKVLLSVVLCSAFVGLGIGGFIGLAGMKPQPPRREKTQKVYTISTFQVEQADLEEIITAFGTTRPNREVTIDAQVAGEIVVVRGHQQKRGNQDSIEQGLKVGRLVQGPDPVTDAGDQSLDPGAAKPFVGDLLLQIDDATYAKRVAQAQNRLQEDAADLERLEQEQANNENLLNKVKKDYQIYQKQFDRIKKLRDRKIATDSELATAELELARYEDATIKHKNEQALFPIRIDLLKKKQQTHQTDLELAKLDVARTNVRPPFSGVVSEVMVELGKYVNVGEPLFRLTDTSEIEIPLPLALYDYAKIERKLLAGEMPRVELSENETSPKRWVGYVVRRAPEAEVTTRTVDVFVHVRNEGVENIDQDIKLLPSVFVHARIEGPVIAEAIVVPRDVIRDGKLFVITNIKKVAPAINNSGSNGSSTAPADIFEGVVEERKVTVERSLRNLAIISGGLKPGDQVAMTNLDVIHTGAKVRIESHFSLDNALEEQGVPALRRYDDSGELAGGPSNDDQNSTKNRN